MISINNVRQFKNKNARTATTEAGVKVFISYNTIIAADIAGITYITSGYYSNTTSHHKTDARRLFNNSQEVEITPDALYQIAAGISTDEILKEYAARRSIIKELEDKKPGAAILDAKVKGIIKSWKQPETWNYKNGNRKTKYYYKATFKYFTPIYYELNSKATLQKLPAYTGPTGPTGPKQYYTYNDSIVNLTY